MYYKSSINGKVVAPSFWLVWSLRQISGAAPDPLPRLQIAGPNSVREFFQLRGTTLPGGHCQQVRNTVNICIMKNTSQSSHSSLIFLRDIIGVCVVDDRYFFNCRKAIMRRVVIVRSTN